MRAADLEHEELLELDPEGGVIRFAGQRALLLDAVAMGLLRKYLVENFGFTAAHAVLTQFGFAHGWRMAEAMQTQFNWDTDQDWQRAGTRIHALEGLFHVLAGSEGPLSREGVTLVGSYEAEQHLLHFGRSDVPVCWTICGLTSGYLSRADGREIYVIEDRCMGKGDAACHLIGRTREEWGDEHAEELRFFEATRLKEHLDVSLQRVTETLKVAERKLRDHRRALVQVVRDVEEPLGIVAKSTAMRQVMDLARRVAQVDSTVLITGESGSGKERIARLVHDDVHPRWRRRSSRSTAGRSPRPCSRASCSGTRGRLHRRDPRSPRPVRGGQRRDAPARRGRRGVAGDAGQAAARAPGARDPAGRREQEPPRRRTRRGRHQPRPRARGRGRGVPAGSLLPAQGRRAAACPRCASAATTCCRWPACCSWPPRCG